MSAGDELKSLSPITHETVISQTVSANECSEAQIWNSKRVTDNIMTPRQRAVALCDDVVWWHRAFGSPVTTKDIFSRNRVKWISAVRGDCIRRIRDKLKWSFPRIGNLFGLDHTTCLHHVHMSGVSRISASLTRESARALARNLRQKLMEEDDIRWAVIPSHPYYSVSDNGLVRFDKSGNIRLFEIHPNGYAHVSFAKGGRECPSVHKLVMEAFIGDRPEGMQVCHIDGNKLNNRLKNLRYGTAKDNAQDRDLHGNTCRGVKNGNAKIKDASLITEIRARYASGGISQYEIAHMLGISQAQINNIVLNKQHRAMLKEAGGQTNERTTHELAENVER